MRTQLKICTEADYLQAHLTVILAESRRRNPAFHNLKKWLTSVLKKWITAAKGPEHKVDARDVGELPRRAGSMQSYPSVARVQKTFSGVLEPSRTTREIVPTPKPPIPAAIRFAPTPCD